MQEEEPILLPANSASEGILCVNAEGTVTFWNQQAEKILGWKKAEIIGRSFTDVIVPAHRQRILESFQQHGHREAMGLAKAGQELYLELRITPAYQYNQPVRCVFVRDITERKKEEEALRASQQKYLELVNTIDVIVWEVDVHSFMFTYVSPQAEKLLGYPIHEWTTGPTFWADHIHPDDREWAVNFCAHNTKRGGTYSFEYRMIAVDGRVLWLRDVVTVILEHGKPKQLRGILLDVTESRTLQESLQQAEARYRSIFENSAEGIFQSTPEGRFLTANPAMARMYGYASPEEMIASVTHIGRQLYVDPNERTELLKQLETTGRISGVEFQSKRTDKEIIWVRGNVRAIYDADGKVTFYEGTLEDVTERRTAEEQLMNKLLEVQKTNFELDHFVYSVSHDLRSPIATIQGLLNIAEKEELSPASESYFKMVRASIVRMEGFINDILEYSRNSRLDVVPEKIDFHQLLATTRTLLREVNGAARLQIALEVTTPHDFYSDSTRLTIILKNLLANSIRYQDPSKNALATVAVVTSTDSATITVTDNGLGIASDQLGKIFNMFYRASEISTGAGLGLYIVKEVVAKLHGSVQVQSEPGDYTTFEVTIPNLYTRLKELAHVEKSTARG